VGRVRAVRVVRLSYKAVRQSGIGNSSVLILPLFHFF